MTTAVNIESIESKIKELSQRRSACLHSANHLIEKAQKESESLIAQANTAHGGILELQSILDTLNGTDESAADVEQSKEPTQDGGDD